MSATTETKGQPGPFGFARMAGSSIAGRDAAPWVTDFLNAAYYRRARRAERDVDDLRLAFGVLTTYWYRGAPGAPAARSPTCPRSTARSAPSASRDESARGTLSREALRARRGQADRRLVPGGLRRRRAARAGASPSRPSRSATPTTRRTASRSPSSASSRPRARRSNEQIWHTYPPVEMPSAEAVIGALDAARRRGRTTRARSAASRRCAPAAWPARRSRSRSPPARAPRGRSSPAAT